ELNPETSCQCEGVVMALLGGVYRRHGYTEHVPAAEGLCRDAGRHSRIYSAAETQHSRFEAALSRIVPCPDYPRPEQLLHLRPFPIFKVLISVGINQDKVLLKALPLGQDISAPPQGQPVAVNKKIVVAPHEIQIQEGDAVLADVA